MFSASCEGMSEFTSEVRRLCLEVADSFFLGSGQERAGASYKSIFRSICLDSVECLCRSLFGEYAELCFAEFGDRVKHWGTFNEIHHITFVLPNVGCRSPSGVCGDVHRQPYIIGHHMLLSHAKAVEIYRAKFQVTLSSVQIATL